MSDDVTSTASEHWSDDVLANLVESSFDHPRSPGWFEWKHRRGPWGPSRGWVAADEAGPLGVRLFLPWRCLLDGAELVAGRAIDGAVLPRARRRGVFSTLVRREMERLEATDERSILFSTSVPASRDAYLRLGWHAFEIAEGVWPHTSRPAAVDEIEPGDLPVGRLRDGLCTRWDREALRWRASTESGRTYHAFRLRTSNTDAGVLVRRTTVKGTPTLAVVHLVGEASERRRLLAGVQRRLRCPLVLASVGAGSWLPRQRAVRLRPSTISWWSPDPEVAQRLVRPLMWSFGLAELEGVL